MDIKIVGTGCDKCSSLYENTKIAVEELGIQNVEISKVEDLMEIVMMGVISVPALIIDGKNVFAGASLPVKKIKGYIETAMK